MDAVFAAFEDSETAALGPKVGDDGDKDARQRLGIGIDDAGHVVRVADGCHPLVGIGHAVEALVREVEGGGEAMGGVGHGIAVARGAQAGHILHGAQHGGDDNAIVAEPGSPHAVAERHANVPDEGFGSGSQEGDGVFERIDGVGITTLYEREPGRCRLSPLARLKRRAKAKALGGLQLHGVAVVQHRRMARLHVGIRLPVKRIDRAERIGHKLGCDRET